ncbi:hypothetical protein FCV44_20535 [Vibrio kanaloae]|uniref:Uncharacterized protein n=1 Tax=Vibrio kanaloae TaxID=170673 RepID=A0A4U2CHB1_9VIBR|nr:hypothetical protein FCV44_20535 [Vibrio kanaloae]TKF14852.1 hypothetical protein FCV47_15115 [Vibrio kanaloae]TKF26275.1 hypothetical protein FCV50_21430 [Vibrio kanaloae]TKF72807.1 hypothetical protein FCV62_22440 [Vibrio kanaloae]
MSCKLLSKPLHISGSSIIPHGHAVARRGGPLKPHDKPKHPKHPRAIKEGSKTVMIDGSTSIKFLMDNRG